MGTLIAMGHSAAARKVLDALDAELAANAARRGMELSWSAAENELREMLANTIDQRQRVEALLAKATDAKVVAKLSAEVRQLRTAVIRLLKEIRTDVTPSESLRTVKARRAARARWDRENASV